jgi:hypothetical protein
MIVRTLSYPIKKSTKTTEEHENVSKTHIVTPWTGPALQDSIEQFQTRYGTPQQVLTEDSIIFHQSTMLSYDEFMARIEPTITSETKAVYLQNILPFDFVVVEYLSPSGNSKSYIVFVSSASLE